MVSILNAPAVPKAILLLVVEDSEPYLYLIQRAFRDRREIRWNIMVAKDGEHALKILFDEERTNAPLPDLILLDWNLPKISGNEVLRRIKEHEKLRNIPVLVFSSSVAEEDIQSVYNNHANGYITKPNAPDVLAAIVETIEQVLGFGRSASKGQALDGFHDQQLCSLRSWSRAATGFRLSGRRPSSAGSVQRPFCPLQRDHHRRLLRHSFFAPPSSHGPRGCLHYAARVLKFKTSNVSFVSRAIKGVRDLRVANWLDSFLVAFSVRMQYARNRRPTR
jgi:CheY-like chemotaxis protein